MPIGKSIQVSGSSIEKLLYMLGGADKNQLARFLLGNGFRLSHRQIESIRTVPKNDAEKVLHKQKMREIANQLSSVFDSRAMIADYRVEYPFEEYILSCVDDERQRLLSPLTEEERKKYGVDDNDCRNLEIILVSEFLSKIGVHGNIEKRLRREKDGKKYYVVVNEQREAMYIVIAHGGTKHPHFHIFTARPDDLGKVNDTRDEHYRIVKAVRELANKYNLALTLEDFEEDLENTNQGYADKIRARENIKNALTQSSTREEFKRLLKEKRITAKWLTDKARGKEYGITFTFKDDKGNGHTYAGGKFDPSLTFGNIDAALQKNLVAREEAEADAGRIAEAEQLAKQQAHDAEVVNATIDDIATHRTPSIETNTIEVEQNKPAVPQKPEASIINNAPAQIMPPTAQVTLVPELTSENTKTKDQEKPKRKVFKITIDNAFSLNLPPGYTIESAINAILLCTPNNVIVDIPPGETIFLCEKTPGSGIYHAPKTRQQYIAWMDLQSLRNSELKSKKDKGHGGPHR